METKQKIPRDDNDRSSLSIEYISFSFKAISTIFFTVIILRLLLKIPSVLETRQRMKGKKYFQSFFAQKVFLLHLTEYLIKNECIVVTLVFSTK